MFSSVECVRALCRQRGVPISTLESDCGFANGYLNPKKLKKLPYDRAVKIAGYLDVPVEYLLTGEGAKKAPLPEEEHRDAVEEMKAAFWGGEQDFSQEDWDEVWADVADFAKFGAEQQRKRRNGNTT